MPAPFWGFVIVIALVAAVPLLVFLMLLPVLMLAALSGIFERLRHTINRHT